MKKLITKILCVTLAAVFLAGCQTNSGEGGDVTKQDQTTDAATKTEPVEEDDPGFTIDEEVEAKKNGFKGETLRILANTGFWPADDIYREEDSSEPVDSAIYQRNLALSEKYGYGIDFIGSASVNKDIKDAYKAGIKDYDVVVYCAYEACPAASSNIFLDLTTVPNLNLGKRYWDQGLFEGLSIDGKLFYVTGDISTKANSGTFLCMFNKKVAADHDVEDLYAAVRNGTWTMDKMYSISKEIGYRDDGDSRVGVEDFFPLAIQYEIYLALFYGQGGRISRKDENDLPVLCVSDERNVAVIDKIYKQTLTDNLAIDAHDYLPYADQHGIFASTAAFMDDRALFYFTNAGNIPGLREMKSDFGVLPNPKYDENQKDYFSYVYHGVSMYMIPVLAKDRADFIGYALETMAYESHNTVTPAYYDVTLLNKSQRDPDSYEMMDIAFRNRIWDLGYFAKWGNLDEQISGQIKKGTGSYANFVKKVTRSAEKAIKKYIDAYKDSAAK